MKQINFLYETIPTMMWHEFSMNAS